MLFRLRPRLLPDRDAAREWGGKGAAAARLIRKGFRVPPAAALGLSEVHEWLESLPEYRPAIEAWRAWSAEAPSALDRLRGAIEATPMPEHWPDSFATVRRLLCGEQVWPLILRSSMSLEDAGGESMAGCFESVVVREPDAESFWAAARRVVASGFTESAAQRILAAGAEPREFRPGVLIMPYLEAKLAGVCFSRDPNDPWKRDGVAEWVSGAGEGLVQGTAESTRRRESEGPTEESAPFWNELWSYARTAEALVGGPADLEWVWDGEQLWFVQARPVATEEARIAAKAPRRRWSRELTLERFPEPLTPMGWSVLEDAFALNLETLDRRFGVVAKHPEEMAVAIRGVVYSDPAFFRFPGGVRVRWMTHLAPWKKSLWLALAALGRRLFGRASAALLKLEIVSSFLAPQATRLEAGWSAHRDHGLARLDGFKARRAEAGPIRDPKELLARIDELGAISREFMEPDLAVFLIKDATAKALEAFWAELGLAPAGFPDLVRSFQGNRTLEMNAEWEACVRAIAADAGRGRFIERLASAHDEAAGLAASEVLGRDAAEAWRTFLSRNGHSTTSWDVAVPTWSDDPARLLPGLQAASGGADRKGIVESPLREERRKELAEALIRAGLGRSARARVFAALERMETFMRIDEEHHFLSGLLLPPSRHLLLEGGEILASRGVLDRAEDVFFLKIGELQAALSTGDERSLAFVARRRRSEWERSRKAPAPYELGGERRPTLEAAASGNGWQGRPMSPGVAVGRVRIVEHIDDARDLEPGTILVTTSPNPALTPLYPLLGGLVSATGSSLSHGFVSAREYALPAVAGIQEVTRLLENGAMVRVDGTSGMVERV